MAVKIEQIRALRLVTVVLAAIVLLSVRHGCCAGPPFLTDDPDPVPFQHWELYTFTSGDRSRHVNYDVSPAVEINNGVAPNTQLHLIVPEGHYTGSGTSSSGIGDTEFGIKYRFITETASRPELGIFPMAELSTGSSSRGLGNGKTWYRLPLWLQKSLGRFTGDIGAGYALNSEQGQKNYPFGGTLLQYELSRSLTLGGEIYYEGQMAATPLTVSGSSSLQIPGTKSSTIWNIGGSYNFTNDFSLLFSGGHSFQGDQNSIFYLSLYRTWGPHSP